MSLLFAESKNMVGHSRYSVGKNEDQTKHSVLHNLFDVKDQKTLDDAEAVLFSDAYQRFVIDGHKETQAFDVKFLFDIHKYFLSPLYSWAGKIRTVNISKAGMLFAPAEHIASSLVEFEKILNEHTPHIGDTKRSIAKNLAIIHCEFNAIHPFREGNGRTIRLFLDLITVHIGYHPIDWSKRSQRTYITACISGMAQNYTPMERIIFAGLTH